MRYSKLINELYYTALWEYYSISKLKKLLKKTSPNYVPPYLSQYYNNDRGLTIPMLILENNMRDSYNYISVIELFIRKGYDITMTDRYGHNLIDHIKRNNNSKFKNRMLEVLKGSKLQDFLITCNYDLYKFFIKYELLNDEIFQKYKHLESAYELNLL